MTNDEYRGRSSSPKPINDKRYSISSSLSRSPINRKQRSISSRSRSLSKSLSPISKRSYSRSRSLSPDRETKCVVVRGLTKNIMIEHLEEIFDAYGKIVHVELPRARKINTIMGHAFIFYENIEDAEDACDFMNKGIIDENQVSVDMSNMTMKKLRDRERSPRRRFRGSRRPPPRRRSPPPRRYSPPPRRYSPPPRSYASPTRRGSYRGSERRRSPSYNRSYSRSRSPYRRY